MKKMWISIGGIMDEKHWILVKELVVDKIFVGFVEETYNKWNVCRFLRWSHI